MRTPPDQEIQIIVANLQNLEELKNIASRSFLQAYPQNTDYENMELYLKQAFSEKEIREQLSNPDSIFFLMKFKGENCGYAKLRWDRSPDQMKPAKAVELERLYFLNEFKGKGLGSTLLKFCLEFSIKRNFEIMWLLVWDQNITGIEFYRHKGFEIFGRKLFQFGDDNSEDILMKLKL